METIHIPVMLKEVLNAMRPKRSGVYIDGTVGTGGHAAGILKYCDGCKLIGIDQDDEALRISKERLKNYDVHFIKDRFSNMGSAVRNFGYQSVDGILLDLGVSTLQLQSEGRGFSFLKDEPIDMRMDKSQEFSASDIVNKYSEKALADILWRYGEERLSRKIARAIVKAREKKPIETSRELAMIIESAAGRRGRIHPATKSFQALRIEVNKELTELSLALNAGISILKKGGRFCVISYHSLEDRIVKRTFREMAQNSLVLIVSKKPIVPEDEERHLNPSSRSAKLRVAERI